MLIVVALGLGAAAVYGASDFFGAFAARRLNLVTATTFNYAVALVVILIGVPIIGGASRSRAIIAGCVAGIFAVLGLLAFYAVLAIGPMSVLSPVIALVQSIVPVGVAAITGQGLSLPAWIAIALAIVAILLLAPPREPGGQRISPRAALLALVSAIFLGASLIALDFAPDDSGIIPAVWEILVGLVLLLVVLLVIRTVGRRLLTAFDPEPTGAAGLSVRAAWLSSAASGLLVAFADCFMVLGLHIGNLAVIAVLVALYPVVTIILAGTVLKERIRPLQYVGIALVIVASLILSSQ